MLSCAILAVTSGLWIPSDVIVANPQELINLYISNPHDPTIYLISSAFTALGLFLIWIPLFTYLIKDSLGKYFTYVLLAFSIIGVINYFLFNKNFGLLSNKLIYDRPMVFSITEISINLLTNLIIAFVAIALSIALK